MTPVSRRSELSRVLILTHQRFIMLDALLYYVQKCDLGLLCERAKESTATLSNDGAKVQKIIYFNKNITCSSTSVNILIASSTFINIKLFPKW